MVFALLPVQVLGDVACEFAGASRAPMIITAGRKSRDMVRIGDIGDTKYRIHRSSASSVDTRGILGSRLGCS
jgi:hypothetical protein